MIDPLLETADLARFQPTRAMRRLRIAISSYYLPSESKIGAGYMAHRLANGLVALGHDVTMLSPCRRPDDAAYEHVHLPMTGSFRTFRWAGVLRNHDWARYDALIAQGDDHLVRRSAVPAHLRTLHGSCFDEAVHVRGAKERTRMFALGLTELAAAVRTPVVIGVSANSLRLFPWRHDVIPNGVDTDLFRPAAAGEKTTDPTILFVGTYHRRKRGALLHQVFRDYVRPRVPDARLLMVCGDAPSAPGIDVLGRVSDQELAALYRRAWLFCLPSTYEGFGVPYVEAMMSGTTVVATPNHGSCEVLEGGRLGALVTDDDLGPSLVRLLVDDVERARLADAALERRSTYAMSAVAQAYVDRIEHLLGDQHAPRT